MKRMIYVIMAAVIATIAVGCDDKKIIPDATLSDIFHDAFVVNAYIGEERVDIDSLHIYEPIFNRYGYTTEDVVHTIGNFSRRKSARLGDVVERAISRLNDESREYEKRVVVLDTIRNTAIRTFTREIYRDTLIKASNLADSTVMRVEIFPVNKGEFSIKYSYKCEGKLGQYPRRAEFYFENEDGFRSGYTSVSLRESGSVNRTIIARDNNMRLIVKLGELEKSRYGKYYPKGQRIEIRDLKIERKLSEKDAIDSLFKKEMDIRILTYDIPIQKDSLALSADTTRVSTTTAHND
jgi:hypothetical protein